MDMRDQKLIEEALADLVVKRQRCFAATRITGISSEDSEVLQRLVSEEIKTIAALSQRIKHYEIPDRDPQGR